jgi:membrane protein YdbS with pleckstrin-like domain
MSDMMASEDFAIGEDGLTKDGYRALEKRARAAMYVRSAIILAVSLVICGILLIFYGETGWDRIFLMPVPAVMIILAAYLLISPAIYYARYRYRIEEDRIDVRRGIIFIRHEIVPVERIHQIEVFRGPINNLFGLADVTITTAGGLAHIRHLERGVAEDIADSLNDHINKILKERD